MRGFSSVALLMAIALLSAGPSAQGLADAARRASAAPQTTARKYTNDDVRAFKPAAPVAAPAPDAAAAPDPATTDASKTAPKAEGAAAEKAAAEETAAAELKKPAPYVVNRIAALKSDLQIKQKQLAELEATDATADAHALQAQITSFQKELSVLEARLTR